MWGHNHTPINGLFYTVLGLALTQILSGAGKHPQPTSAAPVMERNFSLMLTFSKKKKLWLTCVLTLSPCVFLSMFLSTFITLMCILHWVRLNDGVCKVLQNAFTIRIERVRKKLVIAAVCSNCSGLLYMTHTNSDFIKGKGILDPLLKPLWLCTHMKQSGKAAGKGEERYSTKAQLQT